MKRNWTNAAAGILGLWLLSAEASGAVPTLIQKFKSSSGKTLILYFAYDASPCGAGVSCAFRQIIKVPPGFEQVEVFLSGFKLQAATKSDAVQHVSATVTKHRYDPSTGDLEMSVGAILATQSGQPYGLRVTFVVVLTGAGLAQFTPINTGCGGIQTCKITRALPGSIPPGMKYIGLGTQNWDLGSGSGPILLNTLSAHIDSLNVAPPDVNLTYLCAMQTGGRKKNKMYCEWAAKIIAFDSAEMEQSGAPGFPQYTFMAWNVATHPAWANHATNPSHNPIPGFLDAFEGLTLAYLNFPYVPGLQSPIWLIDASAESFRIEPAAPDTAVTDYGIFFGTTFGDTTTAKPYAYQESRAFGFLK